MCVGVKFKPKHACMQGFKRQWKRTGFLSRLLPFSFDHSIETTSNIMDFIDAKLPDPIEKVKFKVKKRPRPFKCPEYLLRQLRAYEELLSKSTGSLPYRHQIQLNAITEASAVMRADTEIRQVDIDTVAWLSKWINYEFKELFHARA